MMSDRRRYLWPVAVIIFVGIDALGFQMRGALLPTLQNSFTISTEVLGLVATAGTLGFVVSVLGVGLVGGRLNAHHVMFASVGVVVVSAFGMALAPTFAVYLGMLFVRGVATGPFRALDRAVLSHQYPNSRGRVFNLYALVWAVGATSGPLVVSAALWFDNWRYAYVLLALGFLPALVIIWRLGDPLPAEHEQPMSLSDFRQVLGRPTVAGSSIGLVLSGGIEGSLFIWLPYFAGQWFAPSQANLVLFAYLLAYVPGRLLYSWLSSRVSPIDLVITVALGALCALVVAVTVVSGVAVFPVAFCLGFCISGIFPTLSAFSVNAAPKYSAPINALTTSASYTGIAIVPPFVGIIADDFGIDSAMWLLPALLGIFLIIAASTRYVVKREGKRPIGVAGD
jgi:MFS family permease